MTTRNLILGRYVVQSTIQSEPDARRWLALEPTTGRRVVVALVGPARLAAVEMAKGVSHRHLGGVLDVSRGVEPSELPEVTLAPPGSGIAVAEFVPGKTLRRSLNARPMNPGKAVAWILRLAEAVQALHSKGAVHTAISPFSVIAEPEGRVIAPVLSQLLAPPVGACCTPERLKGAAPTVADDVWALFAVLYDAVTGQMPFAASSREELAKQMIAMRPMPLKAHGVDEPALSEILERGLTGDRTRRVVDLSELGKLLDAWERDPRAMPPRRPPQPRSAPRGFVDIVGGNVAAVNTEPDLVIDSSALSEGLAWEGEYPARNEASRTHGHALDAGELPPPDLALISSADAPSLVALAREVPATPPVPPAISGAAGTKRLSFNPFERKRRVWPAVLGAALLGGAGVYVVVGGGGEAAPAHEPAAALTAPALVKTPAAKPKRDAIAERDACVRSYFPEEPPVAAGELAFVCADGDFRELSRALFAKTGGAQHASQSELGWYELPATSIIRKSCCAGALHPILPETPGWCEQLQTAVRRVADDSAKAGDLAPAARSFDRAVSCLFAHRINRPYLYEKPPSEANRRAFQHFLSRAAISEARR